MSPQPRPAGGGRPHVERAPRQPAGGAPKAARLQLREGGAWPRGGRRRALGRTEGVTQEEPRSLSQNVAGLGFDSTGPLPIGFFLLAMCI